MRIHSFRVTNFRSIEDTDWHSLSDDGITILVGQNESGKSSILEALARAFDGSLSSDDCRIDSPLPEIFLRFQFEPAELEDKLKGIDESQRNRIIATVRNVENIVTIRATFEPRRGTPPGYDFGWEIDDDNLLSLFVEPPVEKQDEDGEAASDPTALPPPIAPRFLGEPDFVEIVGELAPEVTLFEQNAGLLPNHIDVSQAKTGAYVLSGDGNRAAQNFLTVAGLKLEDLAAGDSRTRETLLKRANQRLTADFRTFWTQTIGKTEQLDLECRYSHYGADVQGKSGLPHLEFWISDGTTKLHPKQRSLGVRWFVSFYLQMRATEQSNATKRLFLLDEPGANLHSRAQEDVLRLINKLSNVIPIIYSTHSSRMIEYDKLYRILAVQREGDDGDRPTIIFSAQRLGAASRDTLSPILLAMGIDMAQQQVIRRYNNVLLEEPSAHHYMLAFWKLTGEQSTAHFFALTGANNIAPFASMFLGWGLHFIVVVDDEATGRSVYNSIKRDFFGDDAETAKQKMWKIDGCHGIEDVFSSVDFRKFVAIDAEEFDGKNSEYVKHSGLSKPVLAYKFLAAVNRGEIEMSDLTPETVERIRMIVSNIRQRLAATQGQN